MKKILWKSEFRLWTALFGAITLFCLVMGLIHYFVDGRPEEAFGSAMAGFVPLVLTIIFAFVDSDALRRSMAVRHDTPEAQAVWKDSCLNPEHPATKERIARLKDGKLPPPIG